MTRHAIGIKSKNGIITPKKDDNWELTGFKKDIKKQKEINELVKYGKIKLTTSNNDRIKNTIPVGVLIDLDGNIICEMHNQVIKGSRINDPTAHGEKQIVDWYLENKKKKKLPESENCILITTLDSCVMCTGALAQVEFNTVIVVALDDYAGIDWNGTSECNSLNRIDCQKYVREHFAYPQVVGDLSRDAFGKKLSELQLFSDITISSETLNGCKDAFSLTADDVRNKVSSASIELADIKNPVKLPPTHPVRKYLYECYP